MSKTPFFSIIIPTLNEELYISKILNFLVNQKKRNFEVIIIDGKSTDQTKRVVMSYSNRLPLIFIEKDPNLSKQKNLGAEKAHGKYLLFFDADMSINPSFTKIAEEQIKYRKGLVFLPHVFPEEKKDFPEIDLVFPVLNSLVELSQNFNKPFSAGPAMIWEKNTFNLIGGFDDLFGEDHYIIRKAFFWGIKVKVLPKLKVKFSLRRMKKEGRLKLIYHFVRAHIYLLFNNRLKQEVFKYEMGGQFYIQKRLQERKNINLLDTKKLVMKIKKFLLS